VPADDWPRFPGAIFKSTLHRRPHQGDSSRLDLGESMDPRFPRRASGLYSLG
jgi:hypothetical protein